MTIELWVKLSTTAGPQDLITKAGSYVLEVQNGGRLIAVLTTNETWHFTQTSITTLVPNTWYHIAGVYDSSINTYKYYINGIMDKADTTTSTGPIVANGTTVQLGYYNSGFPNRFSGTMDQVRVYNAAISATQIQENYLAGLNKLLANNGITKQEYDQRIIELNNDVAEK